jgi:ABC-type transport system involved in multi-copper enzyme maturation permease subunit
VEILAIARNTFREAVRDRVLYLILAFAVILIVASILLSLITVGSEAKIIQDFGLSMISLFGTAAALFIGIGLVYKEIDKRTIHTLLSKPIRRSQFLLGKYLGLCLTLAVNLVVMSAAFFLLLLLRRVPPGDLWIAILLTYVELLLLTAIALFFSSFSTPILSALFAGTLFVVGHLTWSLKLLEDLVTSPAVRGALRVAYVVLPNLERFNVRGELVHGVQVPLQQVGLAMVYGGAYTALVLIAAMAIFERRDFV